MGTLTRTAAAAAAAAATLAFGGCASGPQRPCLEGHNDVLLMPVVTGKTVTLIPTTTWVCDRYGPLPESRDAS